MGKKTVKVEKKDWKAELMEGLKSGVVSGVIQYIKNFTNRVQDIVYRTQKKVIQIFYASALFIAGVIFLSIAVVLLISEYLQLSKGWSFLILGLVLIILAMFVKMNVERTKFFKK